MFQFVSLYILFISKFLLTKQLLCGSNNIENCIECDLINDLCSKCEDKYFPLFGGGLSCIRCNDQQYGQLGCEGKCDGSKYSITKMPLCDANGCNDGYFNENGICYQCSIKLNNCVKCSYVAPSGSSQKQYKCLECVDGLNGAFRLINGICQTCQNKPGCNGCNYVKGSDDYICSSCQNDYYLSNGKCISCSYNSYSITNGDCYDYYCPGGHTSQQNHYCTCNYNYALNSNNECIYCGVGCNYCYLDGNGNPICTSCSSGYVKIGNKCEILYKPDYCIYNSIERFNNLNEIKCESCSEGYALNKTINRCIPCPSHCTKCYFDNNNKLLCQGCNYDFVLNENKLCETCSSNIVIGEGCINCRYENNRNKCTRCRDDYILIENDYICKLPSMINLNETCEKAIRINNDYSCTKCRKGNYTLMTRYNNTKDCYPAQEELDNCLEANEDENGNLTCNKCIYNYRFVWSEKYKKKKCDDKCEFGNFFNSTLENKWCFGCDEPSGGGQIGCNPSYGCSYNYVDKHFYCESCKTGYFNYDWQCLACSRGKGDYNCLECHFNISENGFKCDKCKEKMYVNKTGICDIITYDEYPEVTPGCILPINNYTLYIKNNKCFNCKYGFFKTKDESCIYCKARKNGGPKCDECQYIIKNGFDTNEINCKICPEGNMLSSSGRCYNCTDEVGPGCKKCDFENGTEKVICLECEKDYVLNNEKFCSVKKIQTDTIPNCLIIKESPRRRRLADKPICEKCNDGYYVVDNGECENLSLELCSLSSINETETSIYDECVKFCEINYYPIVDYKDNNEKIKSILKKDLNIEYNSLEEDILNIIKKGALCINNNIEENKKLRKCFIVEYNS